MVAQKGRNLILKVDHELNDNYTLIAGLRSKSLKFNTATIDITHSESPNQWRELLEGAAIKNASISGSGIFKDSASDEIARDIFFNAKICPFEIIIPDFIMIKGSFQITSLEYSAQYDGEITFSISLESASELLFTTIS